MTPPLRIALAVAAIASAGCAHAPPSEEDTAAAAPRDHRPVLVEFWATWCSPCETFERQVLPDPEVQRALAGVRLVRYDVESFPGAAAYERLTGITQKRIPLFLGLIDDHVVLRLSGLPPDRQRIIEFVDELAALGGRRADIDKALAAAPTDPRLLMRAAHWFQLHHRRADALALLTRLAALPNLSENQRAEADWVRGCVSRQGQPRDPRAPLAFVMAHPTSPRAHDALDIASILKDAPPAEVAAALRAVADAQPDDTGSLYDLTYHALAAHQYDLALELIQRALGSRRNAALWDALAEVYYYRGETQMAVRMGELAVTFDATNRQVRADLARFRRADGTPCEAVESIRQNGYFSLPIFYGDKD